MGRRKLRPRSEMLAGTCAGCPGLVWTRVKNSEHIRERGKSCALCLKDIMQSGNLCQLMLSGRDSRSTYLALVARNK